MFRGLLFVSLFALALAPRGRGAEPALAHYDRVDIAPTRTSIYIGTVTMTMPSFTRKSGVYESTYAAKVFPYFFYNEKGRLLIEISDDALRKLAQGEAIEFKGRGVRDTGEERRVEGKATPTDAAGGKITVRVFVTKRLALDFNTTYRFAPDAK